MSAANSVRNGFAKGALAVVKAAGHRSNIKYTPRGQSEVTLSAEPGQENRELAAVLGEVDEERTARTFTIPKQTNFPHSQGIAIDEQIVYPASETTYVYLIKRWKAHGEGTDGIGAVYEVEAVRTKARRLK